ncbi:helix-turn-helix transcriptional regulator [Bradyrhizobium sp. LA7.1]|uniref:helix-turn-helix transcriptional regulator n=1 Tax=Bradyrhizobium sp. LA7.1 TaxID=3156324 RepID=UPI0033988368
MARTKKDRVMPHLLRAQMALRRERDAHVAGLLEQAITHRAATVASGQPRASGPQPDKRVVKAIEYIHANLGDRRMTLSAIASAANVSQFHLVRIFGDAMGLPPRAYVRHQRLQLGRELLAHRPGMTVAAVAFACGFASQAHFSVWFKKDFGTSPAVFRKAVQQRR